MKTAVPILLTIFAVGFQLSVVSYQPSITQNSSPTTLQAPTTALPWLKTLNGQIVRVDNNTTRGQLCKIVVSAEGWPIDVSGGPHFNDVPTSHGFYNNIETALNHDIIAGYSEERSAPATT